MLKTNFHLNKPLNLCLNFTFSTHRAFSCCLSAYKIRTMIAKTNVATGFGNSVP